MNFRLAVTRDLPQIKRMYMEIIKSMEQNHISIWDDVYPCDYFEDDIKNNRLYLMLDDSKIVAAFVLCDSNPGESFVKWENSCGKAMYLDRLGVNLNYSRKGMGGLMLTKAKEIAKTFGSEYLRLFVVDRNIPAIRLYCKNGFTQAGGFHDEVIDENCVLHEYGYEIKL